MTAKSAAIVRPNDDLDLTKAQRVVVDAGHEALAEMKRTANRKTFEQWLKIGHALVVLQAKADDDIERGVDLKGSQKGYAKRLRVQAGFSAIDNGAVSKLLTKIMPNLDEIVKWRDTLTDDDRFRASAPDTICKKWPGFKIERTKAKVAKAAKLDDPTEVGQLKARNDELVEELRSAREAQPAGPAPGQLTFTFDLPTSGKIDRKIINGLARGLRERLSVEQRASLSDALLKYDVPAPPAPTKPKKTKPTKATKAKTDKTAKAEAKPAGDPKWTKDPDDPCTHIAQAGAGRYRIEASEGTAAGTTKWSWYYVTEDGVMSELGLYCDRLKDAKRKCAADWAKRQNAAKPVDEINDGKLPPVAKPKPKGETAEITKAKRSLKRAMQQSVGVESPLVWEVGDGGGHYVAQDGDDKYVIYHIDGSYSVSYYEGNKDSVHIAVDTRLVHVMVHAAVDWRKRHCGGEEQSIADDRVEVLAKEPTSIDEPADDGLTLPAFLKREPLVH